jgi:hypothetical protein
MTIMMIMMIMTIMTIMTIMMIMTIMTGTSARETEKTGIASQGPVCIDGPTKSWLAPLQAEVMRIALHDSMLLWWPARAARPLVLRWWPAGAREPAKGKDDQRQFKNNQHVPLQRKPYQQTCFPDANDQQLHLLFKTYQYSHCQPSSNIARYTRQG